MGGCVFFAVQAVFVIWICQFLGEELLQILTLGKMACFESVRLHGGQWLSLLNLFLHDGILE